jgi:hypothetical protein
MRRSALAAGALALALLGACGFRMLRQAPAEAGAAGAAPLPVLTWAVADLAAVPAGRAVVGLEVVVENPGAWATASTSILWEPAFARAYTFVGSEPAPWRVRIDERGWGVLDTHGVLPQQAGTFRLRFAASAAEPGGDGDSGAPVAGFRTPRLVVVVDGTQTIAETSGAVHLAAPPAGRWQRAFERGPLARIADVAPPALAHPRGGFGLVVVLAALLCLATGVGTAAALCSTGTPAPRPAGYSTRPVRSMDSTKKRWVNM